MVLTHGHEDHAGSAAEEPVLTEFDAELWRTISSLDLPPTPPSTVDVELRDGDEFDELPERSPSVGRVR